MSMNRMTALTFSMALAPLPPVDSARRAVLLLARGVQGKGGRALLVGGCVRDMLLGVEPKDFDVEVYGVASAGLAELLAGIGPYKDVGKAFGVLGLVVDGKTIDVALPRTDSKVAPGHTGFSVHSDPSMTYAEAARRRDFTVNAIMLDPLTGEVIDPCHGAEDLQARVLRVVNAALFADDPLRVLRGLQFAARFNLHADDATKAVMRKAVPRLLELPRERIGAEWRKLLLLAERPSVGLELGMELGAYDVLHPELPPLARTEQEPEWHPEGNVWIHTLMAVDMAAKILRREELWGDDAYALMLGVLCHDFGKPATTAVEDGRIRSRGHEEAGREPTRLFLEALAVSHDVRDAVVSLVVHHLAPSMLYKLEHMPSGVPVSDGAIRALARRVHPATMAQLALVSEADFCGMGPFADAHEPSHKRFRTHDPYGTWLLERARAVGAATSRPPDVIRGKELLELGFASGSAIGELIALANALRDHNGATHDDIVAMLEGTAGSYDAAKSRLECA